MFAPGELIADRYRVDALLGEGAFAAVFAATDIQGDRAVALKCFKPDTPTGYDPRTRARFQREVEAVAGLRSPHTVRLFDHGEASGVRYMVFELIEGEDLDELLRRVGRLDVGATLHVLRQVLGALAEAHAEGLLHRDIKPSNIRVSPYMDDALFVKLLDFGLARGTDGGHPGVTATGEFVGTPRYMAPEQLLGEPLTPATDLYCLGLVAYEMLCGPEVLSHNTPQLQIDRLKSGHLIAPGAQAGIPPQLNAVLEKMTARAPGDRYQSVAAVRHALEAPARPVPQAEVRASPRPAERARSEHRMGWLVGAAVLASSIAVASALWPDGPPDVRPVERKIPVIVQQPPLPREVDLQAGDAASALDGGTKCKRMISGHGMLSEPLTGYRWPAYVPENLPPEPAPAVILLHQQGHGADTLLRTSGFTEAADEYGFIVLAVDDEVYEPWQPWPQHEAEVLAMRADAISLLCVDERRIFVVGHGAGGSFTRYIICKGWARGFATHSLARTRGSERCAPVRPLPYAQFYPKHSRYEPYEGGESASGVNRESIDEIEARWKERNRCAAKPARVTELDRSECYEFDCETPYLSCHVNGGHGWPGTPERTREYEIMDGDGPPSDPNFPMARLILEFFSELEPIDPIEPGTGASTEADADGELDSDQGLSHSP